MHALLPEAFVEVAEQPGAARLPHRLECTGACEGGFQLRGQIPGRSRFGKESRSRHDELWKRADAVGNHGPSVLPGLEDHEAEGFLPDRRHHGEGSLLPEGSPARGWYKSEEPDLIQPGFADKGLKGGAFRAVPGDQKPCVPPVQKPPGLKQPQNTLFRGQPAEEQRGRLAGKRRRTGSARLKEMWDDINPAWGHAHLDVQGADGFAGSHPAGDFFKNPNRTQVTQHQSHPAAGQAALAPATGLECRQEVPAHAPPAGVAVGQKKAVAAGEPVVVEELDERDADLEGGLVGGG